MTRGFGVQNAPMPRLRRYYVEFHYANVAKDVEVYLGKVELSFYSTGTGLKDNKVMGDWVIMAMMGAADIFNQLKDAVKIETYEEHRAHLPLSDLATLIRCGITPSRPKPTSAFVFNASSECIWWVDFTDNGGKPVTLTALDGTDRTLWVKREFQI